MSDIHRPLLVPWLRDLVDKSERGTPLVRVRHGLPGDSLRLCSALAGRSGTRLGAVCSALLCIVGCASGPTGHVAPAETPASQPVRAPLPALPATLAQATPSNAHQVLHVDLAQLRASKDLSRSVRWMRHLSCLQRGGGLQLLERIDRFALATWEAPASGFAVLVEAGGGDGALAPRTLLSAISKGQSRGNTASAREVAEGRHKRVETGALSAVRLGGALTLLGTTDRVRNMLQAFDAPADEKRTGPWHQQPAGYRPGNGRGVTWVTRAVDGSTANTLRQLVGERGGAALRGVPARAAIELAPPRARVEADLVSDDAARGVGKAIRRRVGSAAMMLRLLGLPLDKRLETAHNRGTLSLVLAMPARETGRLLSFAETMVPEMAEATCREMAAMESRQ